jgi:peptidylprolyl isomerase
MKKFIPLIAIPFAAFTTFLAADAKAPATEEAAKTNEVNPPDLTKISKAFGHMVGKNLESIDIDFDMKEVLIGIQECLDGKASPMTEAECIQGISLIQENAFQKESLENLKKADEFLAQNKTAPGVVEIEPGKLQYVILQAGTGAQVEESFSPIIRYSGKFIDGKVFGESREDEVISFEETIDGFKKGIVGMKEGEKRRLFIHPDRGYGTTGFLPPSSLLTFDIEIVKANAPKADNSQVTSNTQIDHSAEIAAMEALKKDIR